MKKRDKNTIKIKTLTCIAFFLLGLGLGSAFSLTLDARRVGMGGVFLNYHGDARLCNPAYLALPKVDTPFRIPVPLGLIQLAANFPALDPDDPDFDPVYITNLLLNPPIHLQLITPNFTTTEANITVNISQDLLQLDLGDLQVYVPTEPIAPGIFSLRSPRVGMRFGEWNFSVAPLLIGEGSVTLSDNMIATLAEAEAFEANTRYEVTADGNFAAMASINASHGRRLPYDLLGEDNPIFVGTTFKYLMGWAYIDTETEVAIITGDPVFDNDDPPDLEFTSIIRSSHPEWGTYGPSGRGFGFDMGIMTIMDKMEFGIGIQDVWSRITWEAEVERWRYNETYNEVRKKTLVPFEYHRQYIPRTFTFTVAYRNSPVQLETTSGEEYKEGSKEGYIVASNIDIQGGNFGLNLGSEFFYRQFPIRLGIFTDSGKMQMSFGCGIPIGPVNVDLGFATHNRNLSGAKGMFMATSLRFGDY